MRQLYKSFIVSRCRLYADQIISFSLVLLLTVSAGFKTPGPGAYAPETKQTCFQGEKCPPAYSMGARTRYRKSMYKYKIDGSQLMLIVFMKDNRVLMQQQLSPAGSNLVLTELHVTNFQS